MMLALWVLGLAHVVQVGATTFVTYCPSLRSSFHGPACPVRRYVYGCAATGRSLQVTKRSQNISTVSPIWTDQDITMGPRSSSRWDCRRMSSRRDRTLG